MKIKRTVNDAVVAANRKNAAKSSGPRTQRGKQIVSGNAEKLGIFAKNLRFKNAEEEDSYGALRKALQRTRGRKDVAGGMMAEIVAAEFFRYGRSLKLDRQIYNNHSPGNAAVEAALQDHDVLDLPHFGPADPNDWPCQELSLSTGKSSQSERKNKVEATGRGDDSQVQLHAKFVNPAGSAMRGQAAAERRFYRAFREYQKLSRGKKRERQ